MRMFILASTAVLGLSGAALAQTATTGPMSPTATNTTAQSTKNVVSPRLPASGIDDGSPDAYLGRAKAALDSHRTGAAQQALEEAETRLLDRSTDPASAGSPDPSPRIAHIEAARKALSPLNRTTAEAEIAAAMSGGSDSAASSSAPMPMSSTMPMTTPMPASTAPASTMHPAVSGGGSNPGTTP